MNKNKMATRVLTMMALCIGINYVGGTIALWLRLPVYLDSIGTIFAGALLGPIPGMLTGLSSGVLSGVTTDIFSLYYSPIQILTGLLAGLILPRYLDKDKKRLKFLLLALILSVPGTIVSSIITVQLFGGITSSGSSMIVQLLHGLGFDQTISVILVQAGTDYLDRLLSVVVVSLVITMLPQRLIYSKRKIG
ncbi:ECF transporter S component [Enterococcus faecium]|uniref:ECF transporter S component n=1 Tax=Enterococcus TaxID=1350 RepID=UPI000DE95DF3|nr:ECF transporter S component [Enterococcus faecium]MBD9704913.1 ECF transporter S component [Enterococcus faecium]MCA6771375.1 ECF transporter S component [Enterococcus faecium]MCD5052590.1 ECF transporter S component [Enterococcus faecium]MCD5111725.1 ECF transporter S component [Enterococcus faecium]MCD5226403.1 ECF transporter S component [Enterococcus faecium]